MQAAILGRPGREPLMKKIVLLSSDGEESRIAYHCLAEVHNIDGVIVEEQLDARTVLRKRWKRLGAWRTLGELTFRAGIVPWLRLASRRRLRQIFQEHRLSTNSIPTAKLVHVSTVNDPAARKALERLAPDIVVIFGTRILSRETLSFPAIFVNLHAGITPLYRGVHGGYWALAEGKPANFGVTVHLVDVGIDTGGILAQARVEVDPHDNFATYPLLQCAVGLKLLRDDVLPRLMSGDQSTLTAPPGQSRLWTHPTAWEYLAHRFAGRAR